MEQFSDQLIDQIRELLGSSKAKVQQIKSDLKDAESEEKFWTDFKFYLDKKWVLHLITLLEKEAPRLKKMRAENHFAIVSIEEAYRFAQSESEKILRRYPSLFEEACRSANLNLDTKSPHPKYKLDEGFFHLEIDEKKRMARLLDNEGRLADHPADIDAVLETIIKEHNRIFNRPLDGAMFLKLLREQYEAILKIEKKVDGSSIPIREITKRLAKNVKGFRSDEFLLDLSTLAEKGPYEIEKRRIDLQQTKNTNEGMLLHGAAARGYIGFIIFKEI